jgi:hypothetical protein
VHRALGSVFVDANALDGSYRSLGRSPFCPVSWPFIKFAAILHTDQEKGGCQLSLRVSNVWNWRDSDLPKDTQDFRIGDVFLRLENKPTKPKGDSHSGWQHQDR